VVCRAIEDCPGPVVDQEFGQFETWTQAQDFARQLNEGLDLDLVEARQIVTSAILGTSEFVDNIESSEIACNRPPTSVSGKPVHAQFVLAELHLAITFCRMSRSKPAALAERMRRNVRKALFNAMHFVCHRSLTAPEAQEIRAAMEALQAAFQESFSPRRDSVVTTGERWIDSAENSRTQDSEKLTGDKFA
jgi:hypothetical protein